MRRQFSHDGKYVLTLPFCAWFAVPFLQDFEGRLSDASKVGIVPDNGGHKSELEDFAEPFLSEISGAEMAFKGGIKSAQVQ